MFRSQQQTSYRAPSRERFARFLSGLICLFLLPVLSGLLPVSCTAQSPPGNANASDARTTGNPKDDAPVLTEDPEVRLGRENAEENDKTVKLVTTAALVERVNRIGQELAAVANKVPIPALWGSSQLKQFRYSFKVVDDKDVNAYSLPGGFIYVNKGLLDYVHSDDELAGVLAHEITHANHHHMMKLLHEQKKINGMLLPLVLAAVVASRGAAIDNAATAFNAYQLYSIAKLNSYGVDAEKDADHGGLLLMTHTHYNPVGLYSFMLRLAADEEKHVHYDMGIYRTHPPGPERAAAAKELLEQLHIPILLSTVDPDLQASVSSVKGKAAGADLAEIKMKNVVLCHVTGEEGLTAQERATRIAKRLTDLLDTRLQPFEIRLSPDKTHILVRGIAMLDASDAAAQNKSLEDLSKELSQAITQINQQQQLSTMVATP